jgi:hypothetical protein
MNGSMVTRGKYFEGVLFSFFLFGTNKIARLFHKQIWKLGESMFSCINQKTKFLDKNRLSVYATIDEGYEFPVEFGYLVRGVWDQQGKMIVKYKSGTDSLPADIGRESIPYKK